LRKVQLGLWHQARPDMSAKYDDYNDMEQECEDDTDDIEFNEDEGLIIDDLFDDTYELYIGNPAESNASKII
jgi:hypothetical protein